MSSVASTLDPESLARLSGLELRSRAVVDGYLAGAHRSLRRGHSVEFAEHREYAPGDDLRYLDWKVYAKSDRAYLKQYDAETNLLCYVLLDVSESMQYRGPASPLSKLEYAQCLAAAMAHLVIRQRDSVGLATFDGQMRSFLAAGNNPRQLDEVVHVIEQSAGGGKSSLRRPLEEAATRLRRRSVVIVISDLLGKADDLRWGLRALAHKRHDVAVLHVLDAAELEFPFDRLTLFRGLESLPDVLAEPSAVRRTYLAGLKRFLSAVQGDCREAGIDYQLARTDMPLDAPLRQLLAVRGRRPS